MAEEFLLVVQNLHARIKIRVAIFDTIIPWFRAVALGIYLNQKRHSVPHFDFFI
jgi:hypothetical protein